MRIEKKGGTPLGSDAPLVLEFYSEFIRTRLPLEAELHGELEGARDARADDARGARRRLQETASLPRVVEHLNDVCLVAVVRDVEEVEDLSDKVEARVLAKAKALGQTHILRDERVASEREIRGQFRE